MRLVLSLIAISVSLIGVSPAMPGEEASPTTSQPKQRYTVLCRWINEHDDFLAWPALTLSDSEKGRISETTQSPFVTGVTQVTDHHTKAFTQQPYIVVLDEGIKIDLIVTGRQPNGATVDLTVEQSKITKVDVKECSPGTSVQLPSVDIRKKRVIDFVKFGEALVVPLGEKRATGTRPRIEIVVAAGESIRPNWTSHAADHLLAPSDLERNAIFDAILATGAAKVRCQKVSLWEKIRGRELAADLGALKTFGDFAILYSYHPHRVGLIDAFSMLSPMIGDPTCVQFLERTLLGYDWGYSVELSDSSSLLTNARLLSRLPELWNLSVTTKHCHYELMHLLTQVRVLHKLRVCGEDGTEATEEVKVGQDRLVWHLRHKAPGYASLALEPAAAPAFTVHVEDVQSVIPALKTAANLKQVLIIGECDEDKEPAARAKAAMQQALPNVDITTFVFTGTHCRAQSASDIPRLIQGADVAK